MASVDGERRHALGADGVLNGTSTPGMTAPVELTPEGSWWEAAPHMAYSTASKEFLVAWQSAGVRAWRISTSGVKLGGQICVSNPAIYARDPSVAYNPSTNQDLVVYAGADTSAFVSAQLVAAGSGTLVGGATLLQRATGTYITNVAYNSATNRFLAIWFQVGGAFGRLLDANNALVSDVLPISAQFSAYDALGLDYNPATGTFMYVSHDHSSAQNGATELNASAVPDGVGFIATAMGANGNFYPQVIANPERQQWLLSTATDFASTTVQRLQSTGSTHPPPTGSTSFLSVVPYGGAQLLSWAPVAGATMYTIRRVGNGESTVIATVTSPWFVDTTGFPWSGFYYTVTAANSGGESAQSRSVLAPWGAAGSRTPTVTTARDYDGDGRADPTVYRAFTGDWFALRTGSWRWGSRSSRINPCPRITMATAVPTPRSTVSRPASGS